MPATTATLKINTNNNTAITIGDSLKLDYTYTGNKTLTWTSNNTSKLTVTQSGVVTGVGLGSTFIKVTDGDVTARITIVVEEVDTRPLVTSFFYSEQNAPLYNGVIKYAGDSMKFWVSTRPYESNRKLTVTSSNSSVVSVSYSMDANTAYVTLNFKNAGTATVSIKSADGAKTENYTITVKADYDCNPGSGILTPEQFVNCFNDIVEVNGMTNEYVPSGYLVLTLTPSELTWAKARNEAEGNFHHWYQVFASNGHALCLCLTYEGQNASGNHIFYVHR